MEAVIDINSNDNDEGEEGYKGGDAVCSGIQAQQLIDQHFNRIAILGIAQNKAFDRIEKNRQPK